MPDAQQDAQGVAEESAAAMLGRDAASRGLGITLVSVAPGRAEVTMRVREDMVNGYAIAHGGLVATLADSAFAVACNSYGTATVAAGFDITFVEPARLGDELVAVAREVVVRGRSGLYDVSVRRRGPDGTDTVVAELRGRSRSLGRPVAQ